MLIASDSSKETAAPPKKTTVACLFCGIRLADHKSNMIRHIEESIAKEDYQEAIDALQYIFLQLIVI